MFIETLTYLTFTLSAIEDPELHNCTVKSYVTDDYNSLYGLISRESLGKFYFHPIPIYSPNQDKYQVGIEIKNFTECDIYLNENVVNVSTEKEEKELVLPRKIPAQHTIKTEITFLHNPPHD